MIDSFFYSRNGFSKVEKDDTNVDDVVIVDDADSLTTVIFSKFIVDFNRSTMLVFAHSDGLLQC